MTAAAHFLPKESEMLYEGNDPTLRERQRHADIDTLTSKVAHLIDATELAHQFKDSGRSAADFNQAIITRLGDVRQPVVSMPNPNQALVGMSAKEIQEFSILRMVDAQMTGNWDHAGLERAASEAVAAKLGRRPNGNFVPYDVLAFNPMAMKREVVSATSAGVIGTNLMAGSFIELMRANSIVAQMGCTMLPGLVGNVDIPRQVAANSATWINNETYSGNASTTPTHTALSLTPKTLRIRTDISRKMLKQSTPAVEMLVRGDIAATAGLAIDAAAVNGTGADGQPQGIMGANGVAVVSIGATGGPLLWAHLIAMETALGNHKRLGGMAYLTNSATVGSMKQTPKHETAFVGGFLLEDGKCNGYPLLESNTVPSDLTKSTGSDLSAIIFGAWPALVVGLWGGLDLEADKTTLGDRGGLVLRGFQDVDLGLRYTGAFSTVVDVVND